MLTPLDTYIQKFRRLHVSRSNGVAPHKPILLLSVMQSIEAGEILDNRIYITAELVARFRENWHLLVSTDRFTANFSLPFYHLKADKFWHLQTYPGTEILVTSSGSIKSFTALKNAVAYAYLDTDLYQLLNNPFDRNLLMRVLLDGYFNGARLTGNTYDLFHEIEQQILNEPPADYKREIIAADEEENFIRSGVFKKVIPNIYNYTCCISGTRIIATRDIQMVDACHIVPFAESHDDTVTNGITLSPSFHRAFDRFLITIDENYKIVVSDGFSESGGHLMKPYHGKQILLPSAAKYYPSVSNLKWHNEKFYAHK